MINPVSTGLAADDVYVRAADGGRRDPIDRSLASLKALSASSSLMRSFPLNTTAFIPAIGGLSAAGLISAHAR